jgi:flagellar hook protein FlgE
MMRALFAGVSGLRNHQVRMDVIGNNIANVNTVAFKSSRVTFEEAFAQLLNGGSRPPGDLGGVNPVQIGLGMNIGSIDQLFSQGNLESTGQTTDLAIQGDSLFVTSRGRRAFYTRSGNFQLDADGRLVAPTNGFVVQGRLANSAGEITSAAPIGDVILPFGQKAPARATTKVTLSGNLDSAPTPLGTLLVMRDSVYAVEQSTSNAGAGSLVNGLYASGLTNTRILGMTPNSTTVTVSDGTLTNSYTYVSTDTGVGNLAFNSLTDLVAEINADFAATLTAAINNATGAITFTAGAAITLALGSSNPALASALSSANGAMLAAATATTDQFSHVATGTDLLTDLRDGTGVNLGITVGETIQVDGNAGGTAVTQGTLAVVAATTYAQLAAAVETSLGITNSIGTVIDTATGALRIQGDGGLLNELTGVNVSTLSGVPEFDSVFDGRPSNWVEQQKAKDVLHSASIKVYDSMGNTNVITINFVKDPTSANQWVWNGTAQAPGVVVAGGSGTVNFDSSGRLLSFNYDAGATSFQFNPGTGATSPVDIQFDAGILGSVNGISQFASPSNAVASGQDGYQMGNLQDISIDNSGIITGVFSNGVSQALAQIALATFNNPSGLLRVGDNMYDVSGNSGSPVIGFAGSSSQSTITPGALESSNVDLSQEFTNMIIAQRGFQANARVITTADEMLNELVNIKR